jgi:hypothetical protein
VVVLACITIVVVGHLGQVCDLCVGLLQNRNTDSHIVRSAVVLSSLVSQVALADVTEECSVESSEMAGNEGV